MIRSRIRNDDNSNNNKRFFVPVLATLSLETRNAIVDISLENHRNVKIISRTNGLPIGCDSIQTYSLTLLISSAVAAFVVFFSFACSFDLEWSVCMFCSGSGKGCTARIN